MIDKLTTNIEKLQEKLALSRHESFHEKEELLQE
jgi:hypothetical protein